MSEAGSPWILIVLEDDGIWRRFGDWESSEPTPVSGPKADRHLLDHKDYEPDRRYALARKDRFNRLQSVRLRPMSHIPVSDPAAPVPPRNASAGRRVVTLSVTGVENTANTQCNWVAAAVCDDGSMWCLTNADTAWCELPPIPQPT